MVPDYDGFYALENIRSINQDAYVVVITAHVDKNKETCTGAFKTKQNNHQPFDMNELMNVIQDLKSRN